MKKNPKAIIRWVCSILAVWLIILAAGGWWLFGSFIKAANSIEKLEDGLYVMEFCGDYGFDDFLAQGGAASDGEVAEYLVSFLSHGFYRVESDVQTGEFGCSTICTQDEHGTVFFGRNYDWTECQTMIAHTRPKDGYESVSTCCLDFLGFGENYSPDGSMMERMQKCSGVHDETTEKPGQSHLAVPDAVHEYGESVPRPGAECAGVVRRRIPGLDCHSMDERQSGSHFPPDHSDRYSGQGLCRPQHIPVLYHPGWVFSGRPAGGLSV